MSYRIRSDGTVVQTNKTVRYISTTFWGVINFFWLLISTFINPRKPIPKRFTPSSTAGGGSSGNGGGGGGGGDGKPKGPNIHQLKPPTSGNCSTGG